MASYQIEEFKDVFQRLRLPDQVGKIADMLTLIRRFPNEANGRPLSELVECIEQIDANPELTASLSGVRAHLVDRAVRGLLARDPDAPLRLAAMDRAAIMRTLPLLGFRPAISEDQIGPASVDLTLGVRDGESVGTTIEVRKGDLVVLPTLESHGEWPEGLLGRVSVRSRPGKEGHGVRHQRRETPELDLDLPRIKGADSTGARVPRGRAGTLDSR